MPLAQVKKMFMVNKKTTKKYSINGLKKSEHKPKEKSLRKKFKEHMEYKIGTLPPKVDLRPWMTTVEDQSSMGSWYVSRVNVLRMTYS